ncbi:hypothetical protein JM47_01800 [Ureaplasma diversum]|uniref:Glycerol-3-phosphate dehydrogenase n=2 Tax=Ureaplasma diversum TaxID=42094 RepID=A0A084EWT5_9BACT|nr:NAD(P)H-dependent glycerol-3-phosphate dehydrogenase [Ureaplasma diversum]AJQ45327.1 hypothetical protein JM47_01800 [Ureaplasma diversum]KEZ22427.1 Glycerol-3-phosphate dehydrogenase [NAD(P)+] [Ureaplasma diversum NCTC 246]
MKSNVLIIGSGAFGSALAQVLVYNKHDVSIYGINEKELQSLRYEGTNHLYFRELKLVRQLTAVYNDFDQALNNQTYDFIILAIPSVAIAETLAKLQAYNLENTIIVNTSKGLDSNNMCSWYETIKTNLNVKGVSTLCGPSFALEVFSLIPTAVNIVGCDRSVLEDVKALFQNDWFFAIISDKLNEANYISCLKNALAIGSGIIYQTYLSTNPISAFLVKGVKEIKTILKTILKTDVDVDEYFGWGDIILTCTDIKSRNFNFGTKIATNGAQATIMNNKGTVEGYSNIKTIYELIQQHNIKAPLFSYLYEIVYNEANIKQLFKIALSDE